MPFRITDDSRFLAIIDANAYRAPIHADWTWEAIQEHFRRELGEQHLLVWGTGMEHIWSIAISFQPIKAAGFREVTGSTIASRCSHSVAAHRCPR